MRDQINVNTWPDNNMRANIQLAKTKASFTLTGKAKLAKNQTDS
jgi:hypothetical protein